MTAHHIMYNRWSSYNGRNFWTQKTGDITWRMRPSSSLNEIVDNDDFYVEFEASYDHQSSNLWKLHTENHLELYNTLSPIVPFPSIVINKSCYFDKCGQTESRIRFDFGKFRSVRSSIVPKNGSLDGFIFLMRIQVVKKSTFGMQLTPTDSFNKSENIESEVVLRFKTTEPVGGYRKNDPKTWKFYVDKFALISVSSVFKEMFSNKPYNNNDNVINDIYSSSNFCEHKIQTADWVDFLRLLYARKQEWRKDTIEGILYLAVRYNVQFLIADCEEFIISTKQIATAKKLRLAETCDLAKLQLVALERMKIVILKKDNLDIFKVFDGMGPKSLKALLFKFCEEELEEDEDYMSNSKRVCIKGCLSNGFKI